MKQGERTSLVRKGFHRNKDTMEYPEILKTESVRQKGAQEREKRRSSKSVCTPSRFADTVAVNVIRKHVTCLAARQEFNVRHCQSRMQFRDCSSVPKISLCDIVKVRYLGEGTHGEVFEVVANSESLIGIRLEQHCSSPSFSKQKEGYEQKGSSNEIHQITSPLPPRYAIKVIHPSIIAYGKDHLMEAMVNTATEVRCLNALEHPNIAKLHGVSKPGLFREDCFFIISCVNNWIFKLGHAESFGHSDFSKQFA